MVGASARYSCLRTPVETSTSPCVRMDPIGQVSARGAKTTTGESILPFHFKRQAFEVVKNNVESLSLKIKGKAFGFVKNEDRRYAFRSGAKN